MSSYDVHQHLLTEPLIEELAGRQRPPLLQRRQGGGWNFRVAGEPDSALSFEAVDVELRREALCDDDIDRALVALSSALGVEFLPAEESAPLLDAHRLGIDALGPQFGVWGAVQLEQPTPTDVTAALAAGCVGLSLPAAALADPDALERVAPLLAELERQDAPLFVHPGPVDIAAAAGSGSRPGWWPALTDYVAQMQAAWFAFLHAGRAAHPRLRVLFAMLAGGAPLQLERYAARSGAEPGPPDPLVFYDNSSYGPRMLEAMVAVVGVDQIVYGSDRPVVDARAPLPDTELGRALLSTNPERLFTPNTKGDNA